MYYEIEIDYTTGNSFNSERLTETVGCAWPNLNMAKLALQNIKEHYAAVNAYEEHSNSYSRHNIKFDMKAIEQKHWFCKDYWTGGLLLAISHDETQRVSAFWIGYFETLHGAKIISSGDSDMEFTL